MICAILRISPATVTTHPVSARPVTRSRRRPSGRPLPRRAGCGAAPGNTRRRCGSVDRLAPIPNLMASREPGRPANANPMAASAACRPRGPLGQPRYLLDERARAAVDVVAEEPAHRQPHQHRPPCDGQIRQMTPITGMHPCRHPPAPPVRHGDPRAGGCAAITTVPTQSMSSITTGDRCGSRTRQQHSPATTREHHAKPAGITQSAPEPLTATNDTPGAPGGGRCPRCTGRPRQAS